MNPIAKASYKLHTSIFIALLLLLVNVDVHAQRVYANSETHSAKVTVPILGTILSEVTNPGNAIDSDTSNFSKLLASVGLLNSTWQNLKFTDVNKKPIPSSPITIKFKKTSGLLSVLDGIKIEMTNGNTGVVTYSGNSILSVLGLTSLPPDGEITFSNQGNTSEYDGIKLTISGLLSALVSANLNYAFFIVTPKVDSDTICSGNPAILNINNTGDPGITYKIYSAPDTTVAANYIGTATNHIFTTPTLTTPPTSITNKTYYFLAEDNNTPGKKFYSAWKKVTVTVEPKPDPPPVAIQ